MTEAPVIRPATPDDLPAIRKCAVAAYEKYIDRIGRKPAPMVADFTMQISQSLVHVLTVGESLGGFAVCYAKSDCYFLENIAVDPAFQSSGLGFRLLQYVHKLAVPHQVIRLYTNEKMAENLSWYLKHGYVEIDRRVEDGFARVYFEKRL